MSLFDLIEEARLLGPRDLAFRLKWEAANRSGLRALAEPIGRPPVPVSVPSSDEWWSALGREHPLRLVRRLANDGEHAERLERLDGTTDSAVRATARADRVEDGEVELFRAFWTTVGAPPNWHLEPRMRRSWPASAHWSTLLAHEDRNGDIKLTWELNRFIHVYDLIRGYAIDGRPSRVKTFVAHLRTWDEANPYRAGVNWASGQELAVRILSWCYGVAAFGGHDAFTEADHSRFVRLVYAHAHHIESHLDFSRRAVANNHLLAEAFGLLIAGTAFDFEESSRWRELSREILDDAVDQFDADGGYCQNSHTYARFALELWLEITRWDPRMRYRHLPMLRRARNHLATFMSSNGRLPNWGNNDGSTLTPWTDCAFDDFRPIVAALGQAVGDPPETNGPWNEAVVWRSGVPERPGETPEALDASTPRGESPRGESPNATNSKNFAASGLYLRRADEARAILRCGPMHMRTGHADQLHVDVWFGDRELACDAGSYSYHYDTEFHRWASGMASHNVITVDGVEPMKLSRKFKWLGFEPGIVLRSDDTSLDALWPAMENAGVRWRRRVEVGDGTVTVTDDVESLERRELDARLHWLLRGTEWERDDWRWNFDGAIVSIEAPNEARADSVVGRDGEVRGWQARRYGVREPVTSLAVDASGQRMRFVTRFSRGGD